MSSGIVWMLMCALGCSESSTAKSNDAQSALTGDTIVLDRVRFLDEMGFDKPVEAFSILVPRGWTTEGGITWKSVQSCRSEMITGFIKARSPDGTMEFEALPVRSFQWTNDEMLRQTFEAGARAGGCAVRKPFNAEEFVADTAKREPGSIVKNVRVDESREERMKALDDQANAISRQFGNDSEQKSGFAFGDLTFADGRSGIVHAGVSTTVMKRKDMLKGGVTILASSTMMHHVVMKFPEEKRALANRIFDTFLASHRTNPVWTEGKDRFLMQLGQIEHQGRMDKIRLVGEQSRAYAKAANDASDARMRSWERQQVQSDAQHKAFVQTIREVETWKDESGSVELGAGYERAWSRGDGSYILSNSASFDPSSAFQDQEWTEMKRAKE